MKKITIRIACICLPLLMSAGIAKGQQIERDVIASAGDYFVTPSLTLSWTMGEPIEVTTIINRCRKEQTYENRLKCGTLPEQIKKAEQDGAGQPPTRAESK